ncbi:alkaline phosphatase family protein [Leptospira kanakyensis]|uniref:Alkaline phosphatase family protein n=1 Tax=Leptospira kanakyensis TaxID=2484968 RepID=A0A6N4Q833_9LEPT|nr:alkaline phosphatase family protein [Leptospira kanakyensis]TGK47455.1 alkaline phosphatase family protein [Leptospira kanakyensis]TGK63542.1 alkaline phosphatase family protein [Leptospira kanakyensis]TGK67145.1 alkaline phosphatase family protein [Leptospira kanakyensis]
MAKLFPNLKFSDRIFLTYITFGFLTLFLSRVLFLLVYSYRLEEFPVFILLRTFFLGFRFDWVTVSILLVGFYILSLWNTASKFRTYRYFWMITPLVLYPFCLVHLFADLLYFENANKHIGYEAIVFLGDLDVLVSSAFKEAPFKILSFILIIVLYILGVRYWFRKKQITNQTNEEESFRKKTLKTTIWILFFFIGLRGGPQESPLRASEAIISDNALINQLALNGIYTTINDFKSQSIPKHLKMTDKDMLAVVKGEIGYEGAEFVEDPEFPLVRKIKGIPGKKPINVVLVIQESWTGKYVWPVSNGIWLGKEVTPYYNSLAKKGHSFRKFYANGGRTSNALLSVLTSVPDRPGLTAIRTPQILSNFSAIGNLFSGFGYQTSFITGDDLKFDSLATILPHFGFQTLIGKEDFRKSGKYAIGAWGYDDEHLYSKAMEEMDSYQKENKPFLMTILTMTTHYPYKVPNSKFEIYDSSVTDFDYLNTYHYSDSALEGFMKEIQKRKYFEDTLFVFVGDHTHHRYLSYYEDRMVPFLLYSPKYIKPKLDEKIGSQLDVLPTILGVVGKETYFSGFGKDLRAKFVTSGSTYFAYGSACGWIDEEKILYQSVDGDTQFIFQMKPPYGEDPLCLADPKQCFQQTLKARAFFNLSLELMNRNSVFPLEGSLRYTRK